MRSWLAPRPNGTLATQWFEHGTRGTHGLRSERWLERRVRRPVSATARLSRLSDPRPAHIRTNRPARRPLIAASDALDDLLGSARCAPSSRRAALSPSPTGTPTPDTADLLRGARGSGGPARATNASGPSYGPWGEARPRVGSREAVPHRDRILERAVQRCPCQADRVRRQPCPLLPAAFGREMDLPTDKSSRHRLTDAADGKGVKPLT